MSRKSLFQYSIFFSLFSGLIGELEFLPLLDDDSHVCNVTYNPFVTPFHWDLMTRIINPLKKYAPNATSLPESSRSSNRSNIFHFNTKKLVKNFDGFTFYIESKQTEGLNGKELRKEQDIFLIDQNELIIGLDYEIIDSLRVNNLSFVMYGQKRFDGRKKIYKCELLFKFDFVTAFVPSSQKIDETVADMPWNNLVKEVELIFGPPWTSRDDKSRSVKLHIYEEVPIGSTIFVAKAGIQNCWGCPQPIIRYELIDNPYNLFKIQVWTGEITVKRRIDSEALKLNHRHLNLNISARVIEIIPSEFQINNQNLIKTNEWMILNVMVWDINDNPPIVAHKIYQFSVFENVSGPLEIGRVITDDLDVTKPAYHKFTIGNTMDIDDSFDKINLYSPHKYERKSAKEIFDFLPPNDRQGSATVVNVEEDAPDSKIQNRVTREDGDKFTFEDTMVSKTNNVLYLKSGVELDREDKKRYAFSVIIEDMTTPNFKQYQPDYSYNLVHPNETKHLRLTEVGPKFDFRIGKYYEQKYAREEKTYFKLQILVILDIIDVNDNPPSCRSNPIVIDVPDTTETDSQIGIIEAKDMDDPNGPSGRLHYVLERADPLATHDSEFLQSLIEVNKSTGVITLKGSLVEILDELDESGGHREDNSETVEITYHYKACNKFDIGSENNKTNNRPPYYDKGNLTIPDYISIPYPINACCHGELILNVQKYYKNPNDIRKFVTSSNTDKVSWPINKFLPVFINIYKPYDAYEVVDILEDVTLGSKVYEVKAKIQGGNRESWRLRQSFRSRSNGNELDGSIESAESSRSESIINNYHYANDRRYQLYFKIEENPMYPSDNTKFFIHPKTGIIYNKSLFDAEKKSKYLIIVKVSTSDLSQSEVKFIIIRIRDVNDHVPLFNKTRAHFEVYKNSAIGTYVGTVRANDSDIEEQNSKIHYFLICDETDGRIWLEQNSGRLLLNGNLNQRSSNTSKAFHCKPLSSYRDYPQADGLEQGEDETYHLLIKASNNPNLIRDHTVTDLKNIFSFGNGINVGRATLADATIIMVQIDVIENTNKPISDDYFDKRAIKISQEFKWDEMDKMNIDSYVDRDAETLDITKIITAFRMNNRSRISALNPIKLTTVYNRVEITRKEYCKLNKSLSPFSPVKQFRNISYYDFKQYVECISTTPNYEALEFSNALKYEGMEVTDVPSQTISFDKYMANGFINYKVRASRTNNRPESMKRNYDFYEIKRYHVWESYKSKFIIKASPSHAKKILNNISRYFEERLGEVNIKIHFDKVSFYVPSEARDNIINYAYCQVCFYIIQSGIVYAPHETLQLLENREIAQFLSEIQIVDIQKCLPNNLHEKVKNWYNFVIIGFTVILLLAINIMNGILYFYKRKTVYYTKLEPRIPKKHFSFTFKRQTFPWESEKMTENYPFDVNGPSEFFDAKMIGIGDQSTLDAKFKGKALFDPSSDEFLQLEYQRNGVGPKSRKKLIDHFESPQGERDLEQITDSSAKNIYEWQEKSYEIDDGRENNNLNQNINDDPKFYGTYYEISKP